MHFSSSGLSETIYGSSAEASIVSFDDLAAFFPVFVVGFYREHV